MGIVERVSELADELKRAAAANTTLRRENERLKRDLEGQRSHGLSFRVSDRTGALSVYGLNAFPVTLFKEQWTRLLSASKDVKKFLMDNDSALLTKAESRSSRKAPAKVSQIERRRA